ncbi:MULTISPECIES: CGNR zinc finger domain-containing protein [unclassified Mesorhizobium]|uniref:CGNR zinc finger domain-containing protein n=1 Tax=unclassified Mesorhizobium TaxID=325217 RepID=UPI000BB01A38|nr:MULTISPECIES: CGNR zinc finger domain-containing protein [unclassified Mesorhizobium]TGT53781.1 hypothetical protein EN813_046040 [Mesorhizobium sp. M00.F.Ca.ET.170.01.1.1]AZO09779.1 hypothetical protein EJ074_12240 [Mesorhizobium sp. M3A.F.Ca.ET.080.04.2.1]RWB67059.1 MAG: hypothetical protein EOQ49_26760 [Mesorhizobium sp.]RWB82553.1 MAG: hypothetical protein EOQ52_28280 [Mesorhizobium sp.]RWE27470.1 MAG: hypothetical protein EOS41_02655 [Mesorhizobium sp.]
MTTWNETDFVAGDVVLDFLNTVGDHDKQRAIEKLTCWKDALDWAARAGVVDAAEAGQLAATSGQSLALALLREFREAAFGLLSAFIKGVEPPSDAKRAVEASVHDAMDVTTMGSTGRQLAWDVAPEHQGPDLIRHRLALRLFHLTASPQMSKIKECKRCTWLFIDHGRGNGRVWCKMAGCGNRAKMERFRAT